MTSLVKEKSAAIVRREALGGEYTKTGLALFVAWLTVVIVTTIHSPDFLSQRVVLAVGFTMAITGILAVGEAIITVSGAILDLSIPAALIFPAWVTASLLSSSSSLAVPIVILIGVGVGIAWGLVNATLVTMLRINPIIVTLGTNFIGIAYLTTRFAIASVPNNSAWYTFAIGHTLGLPTIWWVMLVIILVATVMMSYTRVGRHITAVGGSSLAARSRGISIPRIRLGAFAIAGMCYGIAGVLFAGSTGNFAPADTTFYLLAVIAAMLLAGVHLDGGKGHLLLLLPSLLLLSTVQTALVFFGLNSAWQTVFQGAILIATLAGDGYLRLRARR